MKRVGIEGSPLFGNRTGIGQFAKRLTTAASKANSDVSFEIIRHWPPLKKFKPPIPPNSHLSYRLVKWFPPAVYFQIFKRLGWFLSYDTIALRRYDVMFFYNFVAFPVRKNTISVVFVHDLSFVNCPQFVSGKNKMYLDKFVPRSIKRANHIITISDSSARQIIEHYKVSSSKISIVTPAIDAADYYPRPEKEITAIQKKYKLPIRYILYASTLEPRKNVEGILRAYAAMDEKIKKSYGLVLAGGKGWKDESILKTIDELLSAGENIVQTGYVPDDDLPAIYSGASLFLYPSFYEGFGIPPLEAMACGVPVISADNTSLPEVVGDAGLYVKAEDTDGLTALAERVLTEPKLVASLRAKGLAQAKKFSWEKSATQLLEVLEKIS